MPLTLNLEQAIAIDDLFDRGHVTRNTLIEYMASIGVQTDGISEWILHPHIWDGRVAIEYDGEVSYRHDQGGCL